MSLRNKVQARKIRPTSNKGVMTINFEDKAHLYDWIKRKSNEYNCTIRSLVVAIVEDAIEREGK